MASAADYVEMLKTRLPEGPAWNTSDQTDGSTAWDGLLSALAQEPARIDADAQAVLDKIVPDNEDTDLDAWENVVGVPDVDLTDPERLARIRALLQPRGAVDRETLQGIIRLMADDDEVVLLNRARPRCAAGLSNAGDGCGAQAFGWLCELYTNTLDKQLDVGWTPLGSATVTNNAQQSPVTLDQTASEIVFASGFGILVVNTLYGVANGDEIYFSFWLLAPGTINVDIKYQNRAGTTIPVETVSVRNEWRKYAYRVPAGSGTYDPILIVSSAATNHLYMSWSVGCVVDTKLEERIRALFPIHTRGQFGVKEEYDTLLDQDQLQVVF